MHLNILFANVCQGLLYRGKDERNIAKFAGLAPEQYAMDIAAFSPDIVLCAEMLMDDRMGTSRMAKIIADRTNLPHTQHYVVDQCWDAPVKDKFFGLSILSRFPISDYEVTPLPNPKLEAQQPDGQHWIMHDKSVQRALFTLPDGETLRCFNLHAFPFHKFGRSMAEPAFATWRQEFAQLLTPKGGEKLICGGDFNNKDVPVETILADAFSAGHLRNVVAKDAPSVRIADESCADDYQAVTIDHILCSPDLSTGEAKIIYGQSDHPMLFAQLNY